MEKFKYNSRTGKNEFVLKYTAKEVMDLFGEVYYVEEPAENKYQALQR